MRRLDHALPDGACPECGRSVRWQAYEADCPKCGKTKWPALPEPHGCDAAPEWVCAACRAAEAPAPAVRPPGPARTDAHALAMLAVLKSIAVPRRWRVIRDSEGYPIVRGRLGHIEAHCDGQDCHGCPLPGPLLAVWTDHRLQLPKLAAIPDLVPWQRVAGQGRWLFPPRAADEVAAIVRPRKRRQLTPEQLRQSTDRLRKLREARLEGTSASVQAEEGPTEG
jgi:hypothetical protein